MRSCNQGDYIYKVFDDMDSQLKAARLVRLTDLDNESAALKNLLKGMSNKLTARLEKKEAGLGLHRRGGSEAKLSYNDVLVKKVRTLRAQVRNNGTGTVTTEQIIAMGEKEIEDIEKTMARKEALKGRSGDIYSLVSEYEAMIPQIEQELVDLRRLQKQNEGELFKARAKKRAEESLFDRMEKLNAELNKLKQRTDEETQRLTRALATHSTFGEMVLKETAEIEKLKIEHPDVDFEELTQKKQAMNAGVYWRLASKRMTIKEHVRIVETTLNR